MKISYNWLREYVTLEQSPERVADMLTMSGLEVDDVEVQRPIPEGVVIGQVEAVSRHPNADRLTVCRVNIGEKEPLQVVCGAPNVATGQRVPVAIAGTTLELPSREDPAVRQPITIRKSKIRGEASEGMICAEDELGLSDDHSGIMVLADDAPIGRSLQDYLGRNGQSAGDAVLDVAVTPNRPDAVSHIGVARDLAALSEQPLRVPEVDLPLVGGEAANQVRVEIDAPEGCHRYVAMVIRNVRISDSPEWLQQRLIAVGLRPRNNVVDVTNYVMYECGQPLHAFDYDQVAGATIRVRFSHPEEKLTTLDGKSRLLPDRTLLICDADRPVAIAGVMGGENSEVTDDTTNVLLESAYFDPTTIRRTAKALGLQTDASYRFERGVDSNGQLWAAARAAELIAELAGGEVVPGAVDARPIPPEERVVIVRGEQVERTLGVPVAMEDAVRLLRAIGFGVEPAGDELRCRVPTFRPDVEREIDVIEEIARLIGFDSIPEPDFMRLPSKGLPRERSIDLVREQVRTVLRGAGYREVFTNSLLSRQTADQFLVPELAFMGSGEVVPTLNPISQEMAALRPSLLPGVLEVLQHNANRGARVLRFFETGRVFRGKVGEKTLVDGYAEEESLLIAIAGLRQEATWYRGDEEVDFFDLKGAVEMLLSRLALPEVTVEPVYEATALTDFHVRFHSGSVLLGSAGRIRDEVAHAYDLEEGACFAEMSMDRVAGLTSLVEARQYASISRHPTVERDLAFVLDQEQEVGPVIDAIRTAAGDLLRSVRPFDLYAGPGIAEGRKSVAFALVFGADRTLTDREVDEQVQRVVADVRKTFRADLRA